MPAMLELHPSPEKFQALATQAGAIPVYCQLLSDQLTPVSAYARLAGNADQAFLLESVVGGEKIARYSFLAANPSAVFEATGDHARFTSPAGEREWTTRDPLGKLEEILRAYSVAHLPELPRFIGGAVGYAGYDVMRYYEDLPAAPPDDRNLPDLHFGIYDEMVIFDHVQKRINVVALAHVGTDGAEAAYTGARRRIEQVVAELSRVEPSPPRDIRRPAETMPYTSSFAQADFEGAVDRCKEYIRAGDIFQVVISQRLAVETQAAPFDIYRALRAINPSPFMFCLKSPQSTLVGASPEILCRVENDVVTTRPLAGTRPRGATATEDRALESELLADPKERAEHVMLVDLGRNDVGRVADLGTVKLDELMSVERYAHVMHICSNVMGKLKTGMTAFDALRAVLPVGTVSGAPKIRAMQIIDELEPVRRGPYAGAIGYFDFSGNMDTCIALRTLVITGEPPSGYRVYAQVGAGIVADSDPATEHAETLHKAASMLQAIDIAQAWMAPENRDNS
jgi:anthranilate synthase component 1